MTTLPPTITLPANTVVGNAASDAEPAEAIPFSTLAALVLGYLQDTSTSSVTIGTGSLTFTVSTGKAFAPGRYLTISDSADASKYVSGSVTSYDPTTGVLVLDSLATGGSGTIASWNVALSGPQGATGSTGATGASTPAVEHAYTANTTASASDSSALIELSGGLFTLTFSAASGYPAKYVAFVTNNDTGAAKFIAANGLSSFLLWPGQTMRVINESNVWTIDPPFQRWAYPASTSVYVDNVSGSDSTGDGLSTGSRAFATIQHALDTIMQHFDPGIGGVCNVQLTSGQTYSENLTLSGQPGGNADQIQITGDATLASPTSYKIQATTGNFAVTVRDYGVLTLKGLEVAMAGSTSGGGGVHASQFATVDLNGCAMGSCANGVGFEAQDGGHINFTGPLAIYGNAATLFYSHSAGSLISLAGETFTFEQAVSYTTVMEAAYLGQITTEGQTPTWTNSGNCSGTKYIASENGVIDTNGNTSSLPGSSAGSTSSGGQVS